MIYYNKADCYAVGLVGKPTISGWGGFEMSVMYHKFAHDGRGVVTLAVVVESFKLSDLLNKVSGVDISLVPLLGTVTIPKISVFTSTEALQRNLLPDLTTLDLLPVSKGVTLVAEIELKSGEPTQFHIHLTADGATFQPVDNTAKLKLSTIAEALLAGVAIDSLPLPPGFSSPLDLEITDINYDHSTKQITATVSVGGTVELIPNVLRVENPSLQVEATQGGETVLKGSGSWSIGSTDFPLSVTPVSDNGKTCFVITGEGDELRVGEMITKFAAAFVPGHLDKLGITGFLIRNPKVEIPIGAGASGFDIYLSGEPVIGSFSGVTINTLVSRSDGAIQTWSLVWTLQIQILRVW